MAKKYLDKRQVVMIEDFLRYYVGVNLEDRKLLTHKNMDIYLNDKYNIYLERVSFKYAKPEKVLTGELVLVKDITGVTKIYKRPMKSLSLLEKELETKKEQIEKRRKKVLNELGLIETNTEVISKNKTVEEEYNLEKQNRQKQFVIRKTNYYRKRHY